MSVRIQYIVSFSLSIFVVFGCKDLKEGKSDMVVQNSEYAQTIEFESFWNTIKAEVVKGNKENVIDYIHLPFVDAYGDVYQPSQSLSCESKNQIQQIYNAIFNEYVVEAFKKDRYRGFEAEKFFDGESYFDVIVQTEFLLQPNSPEPNRDLIFRKIGNQYKITGIQYYP